MATRLYLARDMIMLSEYESMVRPMDASTQEAVVADGGDDE